MLSLAILGLLQALFIPGLLVSSLVSKYTGIRLIDNILIATPLSIVLNYFLVPILVVLGIYTQLIMLIIIAGELVALFFILNKNLEDGISDISKAKDWNNDYILVINRHEFVILFRVLAFGVLITLYEIDKWSVFKLNDAIMSWNRWAKEWFLQSPGPTHGYPPGISILYSLVYKLANTTNVQTIAKLTAAYFPFFGLFCFWRLRSPSYQFMMAASMAGVIFVYLLAAPDVNFVFGGFVDPVMAALGAFILYALFLSEEYSKSELTNKRWRYAIALIAIAVSSVALIKQSGVPIVMLYSLTVVYLFRKSVIEEKKYWRLLAIVIGAIVASYYVYSYFRWNDFVRAEWLLGPILERPYTGFRMLFVTTGHWLWILVLGALFLNQWSRRIFLVLIIPLFLFWAFLVSYDLRTVYVIFPWLALLAGISLARAAESDQSILLCVVILYFFINEAHHLHPVIIRPKLLEKCAIIYIVYFIMKFLISWSVKTFNNLSVIRSSQITMASLSLCLIVLPLFVSSDRLLADNTQKRIHAVDLGFNERLSNIFEQEPEEKIMSCWKYIYIIPSIENNFAAVGCDPNTWVAKPDIKYFLQEDKNDIQKSRDLFLSKGISFTEETLAEKYVLFIKK